MGRRNRSVKTTEAYISRTRKSEWNTGIYARLSIENSGKEDDRSIENQRKYILDYIHAHPELKLRDEYIDNGRTGTNYNRPEFLRLLEDVKAGKINTIVVKDLSRFGRNYIECGYYLEKIFPYLGVRFIAINDNYDSINPAQKDSISIPVKNMLNDMFSKDLSRKIRTVWRQKEANCDIWFGFPPYGYKMDPDNPFHLLVDESVSAYVRLMFRWGLEGKSFKEIGHNLETIGAPVPVLTQRKDAEQLDIRGKWGHSTIRRLLINPTFTGATVYRRTYYNIPQGIIRQERERSEWYVIPDTHEAYISREDYERLYEIMEEQRKKKQIDKAAVAKRHKEDPDIFNGKLFCADCGRKLYYVRQRDTDNKRITYYGCSNYMDYKLCSRNAVADRFIRMAVWDQLDLQIKTKCRLDELMKSLSSSSVSDKRQEQIKSIESELENIQRRKRNLYEDYSQSKITKYDYKDLKQEYDNKIDELEASLDQLHQSENELAATKEDRKRLQAVQDLLNGRGKLTKELVQSLVSRIDFSTSKGIVIQLKTADWVKELEMLQEVQK